jgi:hypothetical protein
MSFYNIALKHLKKAGFLMNDLMKLRVVESIARAKSIKEEGMDQYFDGLAKDLVEQIQALGEEEVVEEEVAKATA